MSWAEIGRLTISSQGSPPETLPLPVAAKRLKLTGLNFALTQTGYNQFGWLRLLDLDGASLLNREIFAGAQIIDVPAWPNLIKVQFSAKRWLFNGQLLIHKWEEAPEPYDSPQLPLVVCVNNSAPSFDDEDWE